jgi:hypothetical protein
MSTKDDDEGGGRKLPRNVANDSEDYSLDLVTRNFRDKYNLTRAYRMCISPELQRFTHFNEFEVMVLVLI